MKYDWNVFYCVNELLHAQLAMCRNSNSLISQINPSYGFYACSWKGETRMSNWELNIDYNEVNANELNTNKQNCYPKRAEIWSLQIYQMKSIVTEACYSIRSSIPPWKFDKMIRVNGENKWAAMQPAWACKQFLDRLPILHINHKKQQRNVNQWEHVGMEFAKKKMN